MHVSAPDFGRGKRDERRQHGNAHASSYEPRSHRNRHASLLLSFWTKVDYPSYRLCLKKVLEKRGFLATYNYKVTVLEFLTEANNSAHDSCCTKFWRMGAEEERKTPTANQKVQHIYEAEPNIRGITNIKQKQLF